MTSLFITFFNIIDPPSEGVSSGYESMRCESSANIHSSDSSSEKGKSPMSKGKSFGEICSIEYRTKCQTETETHFTLYL